MTLSSTHDSVPAPAPQIAAQLQQAEAPEAWAAGLQAEAQIEQACAEACRTVLPEHRSTLRRFVEMY